MKRKIRGYSLIELMVAITLGLVILAGMAQIFTNSKQGYQVQQGTSRLQENARFAIDYLSLYIRMADYWGSGVKASSVGFASTPASGSGCSNAQWIVDPTNGIHGYKGAAAASSLGDATLAACIAAITTGYIPNSDVLVIRQVNPDTFATTTCVNATGTSTTCPNGSPVTADSGYWLRSAVGTRTGELFTNSDIATVNGVITGDYTNSTGGSQNFQFQAMVFFLAVADSGAGQTPTLYVLPSQGTSLGPAQPLVDGVEMLKFEYGVDTQYNSAGDTLSVSAYLPADKVTNWAQVISLRVSMIVRGDTLDNFTDTQQYQMTTAGFCYGPGSSSCAATYSGSSAVPNTSASYQRRLIVKDIQLRNRVRGL
jgi:type IV pilus assembly protein PilW